MARNIKKWKKLGEKQIWKKYSENESFLKLAEVPIDGQLTLQTDMMSRSLQRQGTTKHWEIFKQDFLMKSSSPALATASTEHTAIKIFMLNFLYQNTKKSIECKLSKGKKKL